MDLIADAILPALGTLLTPMHMLYLSLGVALGLVVGVLPGLGGVAGLSLVLPFTFGMEPSLALAMMIGLIAPTTTSDTFTSVLMGIPGTSASQATVVDGFPLARRGEGARALSAAFIASMIGGVFGALVLTGAVFFSRPIILAFGFGEQLMLVIFSLSMIGMITGTSPLKGLGACGLGLLIGAIGVAPATSEYRMTFGSFYLSEGLSIVIVGLGMFAMPEIVELLRRESSIAENATLGKGWGAGFRDAMRNKWLMIRCSIIGCIVGALPGLGGSVVDWIAYGHVVQTTKDRSRFGHGEIRGVIAPESANNAKEGGALIPTLLFGIPGSGSMAVLIGGFILIGIEPGIGMVSRHLDLTFTMIWSLAIANIIGGVACFLLAPQVAKITTVRYALVGPIMIVIIFFAAFQVTRSWHDLIALFAVGVLGIYMKRFGWPRPALLIGFVLSPGLEASVYQAIQVYGLAFFQRPLVLVILLLTVLSIAAAIFLKTPKDTAAQEARQSLHTQRQQLLFSCILAGFVVVALADSVDRAFLSKLYPMTVGTVALAIILAAIAFQAFSRTPRLIFADAEMVQRLGHDNLHYIIWVAGLLGGAALVGFPIAVTIYVFLFTTIKAGWHPLRNGLLALGSLALLGVLAHYLTLVYPGGLLQSLLPMPRWMGMPLI